MNSNGASAVKRRRRTNGELEAVNEAIIEAARVEHPVTLRGVYYRVVSAGAVDKTELGYRLVGRQLLALRRAQRIPNSWITDGTRWITKPDSWTHLDQMLEDAAASYRRALWHNQQVDVQIFVEKDAISGVVLPITSRWDVPLGVLRGYASESFAYSVGESLRATRWPVYIYQLGDHDPSGVGAWQDFQDKVARFAPGADVTFERLAVTPEQIEAYSLPTRPTKQTDSRAAKFTGESVEVDAIPPTRLREIVEDAITQHIEERALHLTQVAENSERELLLRMRGMEYA